MTAAKQLDYDFRDRVLVVDGSRATRRILSTLMARKLPHVNVFVAETAVEALRLVATQQFSLITTAYALPDMDGVKLAEEIHNRIEYSETPVIVVTGDSQRNEDARYVGKGITGFFDQSEGFKRLVDYIRWLSPPQYASSGRVLCASQDEQKRFNNSWQQLAQLNFNVLQACGFADVMDTVKATLPETATPFDLLVVECSADCTSASLDLICLVRHELHITPQVLPILLACEGTLDGRVIGQFREIGCNDFIELPVVPELLAARVASLTTQSKQYRAISKG